MKAAQDFELLTKGDTRYTHPYKYGEDLPKGVTIEKFKKGEEVPKKFLADLIILNPDYLELEYDNGVIVIPKGINVTLHSAEAEIKRKVLHRNHEYTKDELFDKMNKMGFKAFRKWSKRTFGVTDSEKVKLINEITVRQEEMIRSGELIL